MKWLYRKNDPTLTGFSTILTILSLLQFTRLYSKEGLKKWMKFQRWVVSPQIFEVITWEYSGDKKGPAIYTFTPSVRTLNLACKSKMRTLILLYGLTLCIRQPNYFETVLWNKLTRTDTRPIVNKTVFPREILETLPVSRDTWLI